MKKFIASLCLAFIGAICVVFASCTVDNDGKHTISFDVDGGTQIESVQVDKDEKYTLPVPVKDGYEFEGWFVSENLSGNPVTEVTVTEDSTYYAKWAKLYIVSLDADGGTLGSSTLKLKEGANLYEALKNYTPEKIDYRFDAWLNGTSAVSMNTRMPASDVSLKARYQVKYSVEIYKQKLDSSEYVKDEKVFIGYDYVGETLSPDLSDADLAGFTRTDNDGEVTSLVLSAKASENVYKIYFDREIYTVTFHANYPDGADEIVKIAENVKFGESVLLPNNVAADGYCLAGWALSSSGELVYPVDAISGNLYNATIQGDDYVKSFEPDKDMGLYAVWIKGYVDLLGSSKDTIFVFGGESDVAYLCRAGKYFASEKIGASENIIFSDDEAEIFFECKLLGDGNFVYYSEVRSVEVYDSYEVKLNDNKAQPVINNKKQLHFDGFDGVTYTVTDADGMTSSSKGTFVIDENKYYVCTFTEGELAGKTVTYWLTQVYSNNVKTSVFLVRNQDEIDLGAVYCGTFMDMRLTYYLSLYRIEFSGFGIAAYFNSTTSTQPTSCFSFFIDDKIILASIDGIIKTVTLVEINGKKCYLEYDEKYDLTITQGSDTLKLDGYGNAVYSSADGKTECYYEISPSGFGDFLVTLFSNGDTVTKFIVSNSAGEEEAPSYSFVKKSKEYAEYNYTDDKYVYTATYLVLNDESKGAASIYCADESGKTYKVSTGTYSEASGLYVYTKDTWNAPEGVIIPFESSEFSSFVFTLGTKSTQRNTYYVNYWTEYSSDGGDVKLYSEYKCGGDMIRLLNFGKIALYKTADDNDFTVCGYSLNKGLLTLEISQTEKYYFALDEEAKTYEKLAFAPYDIGALNEKLEKNDSIYLSLNGRETEDGKYVCTYNTVAEDKTVTTLNGKLTSNTENGVYTFVSDDGTFSFNFKMFTVSSKLYMSVYNEAYVGRYVSESGVLTIDGYGAEAVLNGVSGMYTISEENVIVIRAESGYIYIDLDTSAKSFTVRSEEYGTYLYLDNQYLNGYYFRFDGYGNLSVYEMQDDGNGNYNRVYIDENGTYEIDGEKVTVRYRSGNVDVVRTGAFGTYVYENVAFKTFVLSYDDIAHTYVSKDDWSVITLDGNGKAEKCDEYGVVEKGTYVIVSDKLFYYVNDKSDNAAIYRYDAVKGEATPLKLRARGYYTSDMESLLFSQYGFAIFNGSTQYYYDFEDSNVMIYRRAEEGEAGANEYGFIKQNFGRLTENYVTFEDKIYIYNDGYAITFNRKEEDKDKYPLNFGTENEPVKATISQIVFTPSGNDKDYSVKGIAVINDANIECTVSRNINDDGRIDYFVTVGLYRFKVSLTYGGLTDGDQSASKFTVEGLSKVGTYYPDTYLFNLYISSMFGLGNVPNNWGIIQIVDDYNERGEAVSHVVNAVFGTRTTALDVNGELMLIENVAYSYDEESKLYTAKFEYSDGNKYTLYFSVGINSLFKVNSYNVVALTREQTLSDGNYQATVETLIYSETLNASAGSVFGIKLINGTDEIEFTEGFMTEDGLYYISRQLDENGKITATEYYKLVLTKNQLSEENKSVPTYVSIAVTKLQAVSTYYDEAGTSYIDVDTEANKILAVYLYNAETQKAQAYSVTSCEYSEETSAYTIVLSSGKSYSVSVVDGKATITEISAEGEGSEDEGNVQ